MKSPLSVPLASLRQGENKLNFRLEPEDLDLRPHEVSENPSFEFFVGPVDVALAITRSGLRLLVTGSVSFRARLQCALCGCEFECGLSEPLAAEFMSCGEEDEEEAGRETRCDDRLALRGNWLDLLPMVRDAIHLAVPIAPRCRPDCRGLCPECGADLNKGQCRCQLADVAKTGSGRPWNQCWSHDGTKDAK